MNISADKLRTYSTNPAAFRDDLYVDVSGSVKRFGDVMDPWQRIDFCAIDPAMMRANGQLDNPDAVMRAYLERPRGHSKTTDLAALCLWFLLFSKRLVRGYFFAGDKDQADLPKQQMDTFIRLNPWIGKTIKVEKNRVVNIGANHPGNGSYVEIQSSDVASSYGLLADFILAEELTHWTEAASALWHSIISTAAKRTNCALVAIGNAGFTDSWAWNVRETARTEDSWYFSRLDGPVASWMTPERLAEQRKMLPGIAYSRLWENLWSSGGGDALTTEAINSAFVEGLQPISGRLEDYFFVAGVDLGLTRDSSAVVVLAVPKDGKVGRIRLASHKVWKPIQGQKLNLLEVEQYLIELDQRYGLEFCCFDPWQAEHLMQTLEADTGKRRRVQRHFYREPWAREITPTATNLRAIATCTIESFNDRRLQLYDCEPLRRDLHKLRVEEKSYGFRLVSPRDGEGHGDCFSAFANALIVAVELAGKPAVSLSPMFGAGSRSSSFEEQFAHRKAQYEREMLRLARIPENGLTDAIRRGGVNVIPSDPRFHQF